jgi:hypothetical protein
MSKREQVLDAVRALVAGALPSAVVKRNLAKPERIPAGGLVIVRDGEPGEPDNTLSPLTYIYAHRVVLEVAANGRPGFTREQALDQMLGAIGSAVVANRTLGGLCEFLEAQAPAAQDVETEGAEPSRWAEVGLIATYSTPDPLN